MADETTRDEAAQGGWEDGARTAGDDMLQRLQRLTAKRLDSTVQQAEAVTHETKQLQREMVCALRELRGVEEEVPRLRDEMRERAQRVERLMSEVVEARAVLEQVRDRLARRADAARERGLRAGAGGERAAGEASPERSDR